MKLGDGFGERVQIFQSFTVGRIAAAAPKLLAEAASADDESRAACLGGVEKLVKFCDEPIGVGDMRNAQPAEPRSDLADRVDQRGLRKGGSERLRLPTGFTQHGFAQRRGKPIVISFERAADGPRCVGGGLGDRSVENIQTSLHDFASPTLLEGGEVATLPCEPDVAQSRTDDLVADLPNGVPGDVEVENNSSRDGAVAGCQCFQELAASTIEDRRTVADRRRKTKDLRLDDVLAGVAEEPHDFVESDASVSAGRSNRG